MCRNMPGSGAEGTGDGGQGTGAVLARPAAAREFATVSTYRELRVWRQGIDLVEAVYRLSAGFPPNELYGLTTQLRRAAVSIPSNIAEGYARESTKEYLYHISVSQGSLAELETDLEIAGRLGLAGPENMAAIVKKASELGRNLYALRNALAKKA